MALHGCPSARRCGIALWQGSIYLRETLFPAPSKIALAYEFLALDYTLHIALNLLNSCQTIYHARENLAPGFSFERREASTPACASSNRPKSQSTSERRFR